jgi:hypothetical protein
MGKVIIDTQMLGTKCMEVIFGEAESLAIEKNLNKDKILKDLAQAQSQKDFMNIVEENFGDELIILL